MEEPIKKNDKEVTSSVSKSEGSSDLAEEILDRQTLTELERVSPELAKKIHSNLRPLPCEDCSGKAPPFPDISESFVLFPFLEIFGGGVFRIFPNLSEFILHNYCTVSGSVSSHGQRGTASSLHFSFEAIS